MKKLLLLGAALLGFCTLGQTVQAGPDDRDYSYERPAPRVYEGRVAEDRYCPPPAVYVAPPPPVYVYGGCPRYYRHRHFRPYGYGYGYGYGYRYTPGIHIGIGF